MRRLRFLLKLFRGHWIQIGISLIMIVTSVILSTLIPLYEGNVVTLLLNGDINQQVSILLMKMIIFGIAAFLLNMISVVILNECVQTVMADFKLKLLKKYTNIKLKDISKNSSMYFYEVISNDAEILSSSVEVYLQYILQTIVTIIMISVMMIYIHKIFIITVMLMIFGMLWLVKTINSKNYKNFEMRQKKFREFDEIFEDVAKGKEEIDNFNIEDFYTQKYLKTETEYNLNDMKAEISAMSSSPIFSLFTFAILALEIIISIYLIQNGIMQIGSIESIYRYTTKLSSPIMGLTNISNSLQAINISIDRILNYLELQEKEIENKTIYSTNHLIAINDMSFSYDEIEILHNIHLEIDKGERVVIAGRTGSGKSTLVKLLYKLLEDYHGFMQFLGNEYSSISLDLINQYFSVVPQNIIFFKGTVLENILYANDNVTLEKVKAISKDIGIYELIMELDDGFETVIDNHDDLPNKTKQMIALLRALVKDSEIFIFDESTSYLDPVFEHNVQLKLNTFLKHKTSIIITHKLSSIMDSDRVIVLENGKIIDTGTHVELLKRNEYYRNLCNEE